MFNRKSEYTDNELDQFRDMHLANAREWQRRLRECEAGCGPAGCDPIALAKARDHELHLARTYGVDPAMVL